MDFDEIFAINPPFKILPSMIIRICGTDCRHYTTPSNEVYIVEHHRNLDQDRRFP